MAEYTCAECDGTFTKVWSDEDAAAEYAKAFGCDEEDIATVCDDCYKRIMALHAKGIASGFEIPN